MTISFFFFLVLSSPLICKLSYLPPLINFSIMFKLIIFYNIKTVLF